MSLRTMVGAALASLAGLASVACSSTRSDPSLEDEVRELARRSEEANDALLRGDVDKYSALIPISEDFTLMSPFGGKPTRRPDKKRMDAMRTFFKNGRLEQEVVQTYASPDLVVLAVIEHAHGEVGTLAPQDWGLRVTLVYRRVGASWHLAHRHADPLSHGVSLEQAAALGRGDHPG
jgi:ketosteroid isomerase-like protein